MAEKLGEALLEIDTDDRPVNQKIDRTERNTRRLGVTFDKVGRRALVLGRTLALAAAGATAAFGVMIKNQIDHADAMSKSARRAGVMTEALSELAWAGELSDVSLEKITSGLQRLSYNMGQAATGADKTLAKAFKQLGIDITDADGRLRAADAVFIDIADRFAAMEGGADKTALAMRLFGRAGGEMITLLDNGRDGLREMADEANRLGIVISTDMGARAEVFNDTLSRVRSGFEGIVTRIAYDLLPQLQAFADWLNDPEIVKNAETMALSIVTAFGWIVDAVREVIGWLKTLGEWWGKLKGVIEWASTHDILGRPLEGKQQNPVAAALERERNSKVDPSFVGLHSSLTPQPSSQASRASEPSTEPPTRKPFRFAELTAGGGKTAKQEYDELTASAKEFVDIQRTEQQALNLTETAANALRYEQELLIEAKRAGIELGPAQAAELKALAQQMAEAEGATNALADSLDFRRDTFRSFFSDLRSGLSEGKGFWESFKDAGLAALDKISDRIFDKAIVALDQLDFSLSGLGSGAKGGGGGLFGGLGGLLGGLFSGFFADGGIIPEGRFGIVGEKGPEPVFGTSRGAAVLPNSALRAASEGGGNTVTLRVIGEEGKFFAPKIRAEAQGVAVKVVQDGLGQYDAGLSGRISDVMERQG